MLQLHVWMQCFLIVFFFFKIRHDLTVFHLASEKNFVWVLIFIFCMSSFSREILEQFWLISCFHPDAIVF